MSKITVSNILHIPITLVNTYLSLEALMKAHAKSESLVSAGVPLEALHSP